MGAKVDVRSALRALRLFNEKADKLESLSFAKRLLSEESGFRMEYRPGEGITAARYGPDAESIDAFVLTLRFFVQNNEPTSFANMAKRYDGLCVASLLPESLANDFNELRDGLNRYLDGPTFVVLDETPLARRELYEVFLFGGLAHANEAKKALYDGWKNGPFTFFYLLLENEFVSILARMFHAILVARGLNEAAIAELQARE